MENTYLFTLTILTAIQINYKHKNRNVNILY